MKSTILVMLLGLILGWGNIVFSQEVEFLNPDIIDYGDVPQGEEIKGEIKFVNKGSEPIELEGVRPQCGCTAVKPDKMVYASDEMAIIPFSVDTKKFRPGVIRKSIHVAFKNAPQLSKTIFIQAKVVTDLNVNPRFINFQQVMLNPDTLYSEFIEIENTSSEDIEITKISTTSDLLKIHPESVVVPAGKSHLVRLELTPKVTGRHNTTVTIETNNSRTPIFSVPVFINIRETHPTGSK